MIKKEFNSNSGQNPRNSKQLKEKYLNMKKKQNKSFSMKKGVIVKGGATYPCRHYKYRYSNKRYNWKTNY